MVQTTKGEEQYGDLIGFSGRIWWFNGMSCDLMGFNRIIELNPIYIIVYLMVLFNHIQPTLSI